MFVQIVSEEGSTAAMTRKLVKFISCISFFSLASFAFFGAQTEASSNGAPLAACDTMGDPHVVFSSKPSEESPFGVFLSKVIVVLLNMNYCMGIHYN